MEIIISKYVSQKKIEGHDLYAVIEEDNDQVIGVVDVVRDRVLRKVYIYETIFSTYLTESDFLQELFDLLNKKYLELESNNFIEIRLDLGDTVLQDAVTSTGFKEGGVVQYAWRNRSFEYSEAKLFIKEATSH
jgi:hypothetical protein